MGSYESLVGAACGISVPSSYLGDPGYAALCSLPQALLGIDVFVWYDILFRLLTNKRVLFCITLGAEIYLKFNSRSPSPPLQTQPLDEEKYYRGAPVNQDPA